LKTHLFLLSKPKKINLEKSIQSNYSFLTASCTSLKVLVSAMRSQKSHEKKHKDFDNYLFDTQKNYVNQRKKSPQVPKKQ